MTEQVTSSARRQIVALFYPLALPNETSDDKKENWRWNNQEGRRGWRCYSGRMEWGGTWKKLRCHETWFTKGRRRGWKKFGKNGNTLILSDTMVHPVDYDGDHDLLLLLMTLAVTSWWCSWWWLWWLEDATDGNHHLYGDFSWSNLLPPLLLFIKSRFGLKRWRWLSASRTGVLRCHLHVTSLLSWFWH